MNTDNNSTTGNDVVSRLINVLVTEVLLKVDSRINEQLVSLSNRVTELERKLELGTEGSTPLTEERVTEMIEDAISELDVDSKVQDELNSFNVTRALIEESEGGRIAELITPHLKNDEDFEEAVHDAIDCIAKADIVRHGLKSILNVH